MIIRFNIIITIFFLALFSFEASSQQRGQAQQEEVPEIPPQIKPKRLELLHRIANQTIIDNFAFKDEDELNNLIMELIREKEILDTNLVNRQIQQKHRVINLNFQPNQDFKNINLAYGYTTTLVFLDKNGNPWDLYDYSVGDDNLMEIGFRQKNILTIKPKKHSGTTNLTMMFENGRMPVSINLQINNNDVDLITTLYMEGIGNNSPEERTVVMGGGKKNDLSYLAKFDGDYMSDLLSNIVPEDFNEKYAYLNDEMVSRREFRFFQKDSFLYVRTKHRPHHPEPTMVRNSSDGETKVYKIPYLNFPLFIVDGKIETLHIR